VVVHEPLGVKALVNELPVESLIDAVLQWHSLIDQRDAVAFHRHPHETVLRHILRNAVSADEYRFCAIGHEIFHQSHAASG
jgi:hypothetical protein